VSSTRIWRRRLIAIAVMILLLFAGYTLWLRDSSLFSVDEVEVKGLTANQEKITRSLRDAAEGMTTLHIDDGQLRDAAQQFPTIASIKADATLPHKLTITVTERLPVATVSVDGEATAVSEAGLLLPGLRVSGEGLPALDVDQVKGPQLDAEGTAQAEIVGGAPEPLRKRVDSVSWDPERGGVVVELAGAPEIRFGDGSEAERKWEAAAAVLLDPGRASASYVNVVVPDRPVTGG
jgi:cell division protein FtsQ